MAAPILKGVDVIEEGKNLTGSRQKQASHESLDIPELASRQISQWFVDHREPVLIGLCHAFWNHRDNRCAAARLPLLANTIRKTPPVGCLTGVG